MKKSVLGLLLFNGFVLAEVSDSSDFMELDEPYKYVTGAYWGVSVGPTFVKHKLSAQNENTGTVQRTSVSKTQMDLALLGGFGTSFYKDYYIGLEMELMNRYGKGVHYEKDSDALGLKFHSQFGLNMNVRFGYLFPKQGNMIYAIVGFSRTLGKVVEKRSDGKAVEGTFGSYYPVVGVGLEHKINYDWNVRLDVKYSITSEDSGRHMSRNASWKYDAKPQSVGIRLAITRNI